MSAVPYPMPVVTRACELRDAGWSFRRVQEFVEQETGYRPSLNTLCKWVDPYYREKANSRNRMRHRRVSAGGGTSGGRLGSHRHRPEFQEHRVRVLADLGVPYLSIARVMAFDYPEARWNDDRISKLLGPSRQRGAARRAAA